MYADAQYDILFSNTSLKRTSLKTYLREGLLLGPEEGGFGPTELLAPSPAGFAFDFSSASASSLSTSLIVPLSALVLSGDGSAAPSLGWSFVSVSSAFPSLLGMAPLALCGVMTPFALSGVMAPFALSGVMAPFVLTPL